MMEHIFRRCRTLFMICVIITLAPFFLTMAKNVLWQSLPLHRFGEVAAWNQENVSDFQKGIKFDVYLHSHAIGQSKSFYSKNNTRLILLWSPLFEGMNLLEIGSSYFKDSGCSETRCDITSDRKRYLKSDAIVFHLRTMTLYDIPRYRLWRQKWIFLNFESPPYSRFHGLAFMSEMFNWTMTYRNDSDIFTPYGRFLKVLPKSSLNQSQLYLQWERKSKVAVWIVSHCNTDGRREDFVREMEKYIEVDTFGECGTATCPLNKTQQCLENFSEKYFFYLAFENSICDGYVTEKFYRTLQYNMIPVVFGGGQYSTIAPYDSFINAFDFSSPKELSSHLHRVASDFSLYAKYFQWKLSGYDVKTTFNSCNLCKKLHSKAFYENSVYLDMDEWWIKRSNCRRWRVN